MSGGVLDATTSTALTRTTVHAQYNGKAFGFVMLNNLIPIVLNVKVPGDSPKKAILVFGDRAHKTSPYKDYGVRRKCCRRVLLFNMQHYYKCYLPNHIDADGTLHTPYTFNYCEKHKIALKDACNHLVQTNTVRQYNVNKFIYQAPQVLQSPGNSELFSYRKGNC